jgi:type I restriction enzyme M protein
MGKNNQNGKSLESWIWDAACSIRGVKDEPKHNEK